MNNLIYGQIRPRLAKKQLFHSCLFNTVFHNKKPGKMKNSRDIVTSARDKMSYSAIY